MPLRVKHLDFECTIKELPARFCIINVFQLAKLLQFAYRVMRRGYSQPLAQPVGEPSNRLKFTVGASWRNWNDNGWVHTPAAEEICRRVYKFFGGCLVGAILQTEKQLPDLGAMSFELWMTELVITDV